MGEYWWSAILEGEEHIDINQINKERSMATVGEEEHAVLDRLTFDYRQKLQGKPQSHELVWPQQWVGAGGWGKAVQLAAGPPVQAALNGESRVRPSGGPGVWPQGHGRKSFRVTGMPEPEVHVAGGCGDRRKPV